MEFFETQLKMPLMNLPVRSVIVETKNHRLLISPGSKLTPEDYQKMGTITDLIAPNLFHCAGIPLAQKYFPQAKTWGVKGVKEIKPQISWDALIEEATWPFSEELPIVYLEGMPKVNEVLLLDKASKSLIVTDFCFNLINQKGFGSWLILNLFGTYNRLGISKFFLSLLKNKEAFKKSIEFLWKWDFENIIVSHGENVMGEGKERLEKALSVRGFLVK